MKIVQEFISYFKNKKNLINLLVLAIMVLGVPLGVNLARQQQILKSKAVVAPIVFSGPNVKTINNKLVATKNEINLEITAPDETGAASSTSTSTSNTANTSSNNSSSNNATNTGGSGGTGSLGSGKSIAPQSNGLFSSRIPDSMTAQQLSVNLQSSGLQRGMWDKIRDQILTPVFGKHGQFITPQQIERWFQVMKRSDIEGWIRKEADGPGTLPGTTLNWMPGGLSGGDLTPIEQLIQVARSENGQSFVTPDQVLAMTTVKEDLISTNWGNVDGSRDWPATRFLRQWFHMQDKNNPDLNAVEALRVMSKMPGQVGFTLQEYPNLPQAFTKTTRLPWELVGTVYAGHAVGTEGRYCDGTGLFSDNLDGSHSFVENCADRGSGWSCENGQCKSGGGGGNYCEAAGYHKCSVGAPAGSCTKDGKTCTAYEKYQCNFEGQNYCDTSNCNEPCSGGGDGGNQCQGSISFNGSCSDKKLSVSWNVTNQFGSCNIYLRGGQRDETISSDCSGSKTITQFGGASLNNDGIYELYVSNGGSCNNQNKGKVEIPCRTQQPKYKCVNRTCQVSTDGTGTTDSTCGGTACTGGGTTPPTTPPGGGNVTCNDISMSVSPSQASAGQQLSFNINGDVFTFLGDDYQGAVKDCSGEWNSKKCTADKTGNFTWTHTWKKCVGDTSNCSPQCSKTASFTIGAAAPVIASFRIAETPDGLASAPKKDYTRPGPVVISSFKFSSDTPGTKTIFVQFYDKDDKKVGERKQASIELLGPNPAITGCSLNFEGSNVVFDIKGKNFGATKGSAKSGETALQIKEWKDTSLKLTFPNAPVGQSFPISLTNVDEQVGEGTCSAFSTISLGAKVFCRAPSSHDSDNVEMILVGLFEGAKKTKETVKIDRNGNIANLTQRLEEGKKYMLSLKAPRSLRRVTEEFTASSGTTNIPNFALPVGDIFPADGGDGKINTLDKAELNRQWIAGQSASGRSGDFNLDSRVNSIDWACMRYDFGREDASEPLPGVPAASPVPAPSTVPSPSPSASAGVCILATTTACSPTNQHFCKDFPTSCDIPAGWVVKPSFACTVSWQLTPESPAPNTSPQIIVTGRSTNAGWSNTKLYLDGQSVGTAKIDTSGSDPKFTYEDVSSGSAGEHTLNFFISDGQSLCQPAKTFTTK